MGSIDRRLARLEDRAGGAVRDEENRVGREALRRVTDEELLLVEAFFERAVEGDAEPTEEEEAAIIRYEELKEEVSHEH